MKANKYRGKRQDNGEWVYDSVVQEHTNDGAVLSFIIPASSCAQKDGNAWKVQMYQVDTKTVGMFTGITDIKGTPIYEGDLVLSSREYDIGLVEEGLCEVFYSCEDTESPTGWVGFWTAGSYPSSYRYEQLSAYKEQFYRVVGNIHDDGHLCNSDFDDDYGHCMSHLGDWWKNENDDSDHKLQEYLKELKLKYQK